MHADTHRMLNRTARLKHDLGDDKKLQGVVTDFEIRLMGTGFVEIGPGFGFGFDGLCREQCKVLSSYIRECRCCK